MSCKKHFPVTSQNEKKAVECLEFTNENKKTLLFEQPYIHNYILTMNGKERTTFNIVVDVQDISCTYFFSFQKFTLIKSNDDLILIFTF